MRLNSIASKVGWGCPLEVQNTSFRILSTEEGGDGALDLIEDQRDVG